MKIKCPIKDCNGTLVFTGDFNYEDFDVSEISAFMCCNDDDCEGEFTAYYSYDLLVCENGECE